MRDALGVALGLAVGFGAAGWGILRHHWAMRRHVANPRNVAKIHDFHRDQGRQTCPTCRLRLPSAPIRARRRVTVRTVAEEPYGADGWPS